MIATLRLYLGGAFFVDKEIMLHDNVDDLTWETNCEIRQIQIDAAVQTFKISYLRQINKHKYNDQVTISFKSKIQSHESEYDFS
jgi:hypothetical protein